MKRPLPARTGMFAVLVLLSAALGMRPAAAAKDELVIGISQFPPNFHPNMDAATSKSFIHGMTERPFTTFDQKWKLICMLCTELPTIENGLAKPFDLPAPQQASASPQQCGAPSPPGTKGIELTYTIQPNATWGDGTPVTTDDVLFTYEVGRNPKSGITNLELYRRITKIVAHDKKRFTMTVDQLTFDYSGINDFRVVPAHLERAAYAADPETYRQRSLFETNPTNPGLYMGPYRITEVVSGSHVVLEPNQHWWGAKPAFKRIVVRAIENTAALEANLLSGSIDYVAGELGFSLDQGLAFEKRQGANYNVRYVAGLIHEHIDFNLDNPILKDVRVRRALVHGIDREALSKQLFEGKQPVSHSFVSPLDWISSDEITKYGYDPAKANQLLDQAGYNVMRDGVRHNAQGTRLSFELMTTAGNRLRETVQQVLQSQWRRVGVEVRLRNEPARVFFGDTLRKREFTAMGMFAWVSSPENVPRSTLRSDEIPTAANGYSGQNYTGYCNVEMDKLIDTVSLELDREKRRVMWRQIQELYATDLPVLPLYYRADPYIVPKWLTGIEPTGHQYPSTLWIENWRSTQ